ncbi:hypothetical protein QTP70_004417, partial [Hemibagrus guttatus]
EFKLIGPSGKEEYHHSAVTLSCRLFPEISAVDLEIRWFQETACVCVHKNREVTEGRGYEGRELSHGSDSCLFLSDTVSKPYSMAGLTTVLYTFPLILADIF